MSHPLLNIQLSTPTYVPSETSSNTQQSPRYNNDARPYSTPRPTSSSKQNQSLPPLGSYTPFFPPNSSPNALSNRESPVTGNKAFSSPSDYRNLQHSKQQHRQTPMESTFLTTNDSLYCEDSISCRDISDLMNETCDENEDKEAEDEGIDDLLAQVESALRLDQTTLNVGEVEEVNELMHLVRDALGSEAVSVYSADRRAQEKSKAENWGNTSVNSARIPSVPRYHEFQEARLQEHETYMSPPHTRQVYTPSPARHVRNEVDESCYSEYALQTPNIRREVAQSRESSPFAPSTIHNTYFSRNQTLLGTESVRTERKPSATVPTRIKTTPVYSVPRIEYDSFITKGDDDTFIERAVAPMMSKYGNVRK
ncbi:hypothetical protein HDU79_001155 [Rhizoclosmatium sp. JEL0117]|nr:hypothetical protein HDU79_001155 [Rhizoclosmatium sp. JEL0117]